MYCLIFFLSNYRLNLILRVFLQTYLVSIDVTIFFEKKKSITI